MTVREMRPIAALRAAPHVRHGWFIGVAAVGVVLRLFAMLGYRPALWFPDSYSYVVTAMRPRPDLVRPAGYSMFLRALEPFHSFAGVVLVQHVLGVLTGVLVYAIVCRWKPWVGALAAAPVLLDAYQIELEHLLVSDTLFMFLVVAAVWVGIRRLTWRRAVAIGLLLAAATLTRTIGLPLIAVFGFFVFRYGGLKAAGVMLVAALIPVLAYAGWFYATYQRVGLVGSNGVFLYVRTMTFADCGVMRPPPDVAVLCESRPPGQRPPPQFYAWDPASPLVRLPGITFTSETDGLAMRFAMLAITRQPLDYAGSLLSELGRTFAPGRPIYPDAEVYAHYEFPSVAPPAPVRYVATVGAEFAEEYERGPIATQVVEPYAGWLRAYQKVAALPGPALLIILLAPPVAVVLRRRQEGRARVEDRASADGRASAESRASADGPEDAESRENADGPEDAESREDADGRASAESRGGAEGRAGAGWVLPWVVAWGLLVIPVATAVFDYRYVLPAVPLACLAAALCLSPGVSVNSE